MTGRIGNEKWTRAIAVNGDDVCHFDITLPEDI